MNSLVIWMLIKREEPGVNNQIYNKQVEALSKDSKVRKPIAQIFITFSAIGFLLGWFTSAGFYSFVMMGICATVPLLIGPKNYRVYGAVALLIAVSGAHVSYKNHQRSPYFLRAKVNNAYLAGSDYSRVVENYWKKNHKWPDHASGLKNQKATEHVRSFALESNGAIRVFLSNHQIRKEKPSCLVVCYIMVLVSVATTMLIPNIKKVR